jgi:hypothetical protein
MVAWRVAIRDGSDEEAKAPPRAEFTHSTWKGALISEEDLRTCRPDWSPRLSPRGEARRSVLELCDGNNALIDIEHEMQRRHPELLADGADAARFVAEVVASYGV